MTIINSIDGVNAQKFHSLEELKEYHNISDIEYDNMLRISNDITEFLWIFSTYLNVEANESPYGDYAYMRLEE